MRRLIFSRDLEEFCFKDLLNMVRPPASIPNPEAIIKFIVAYYLTVYVRKTEDENLLRYLEMTQSVIYEYSLEGWII